MDVSVTYYTIMSNYNNGKHDWVWQYIRWLW